MGYFEFQLLSQGGLPIGETVRVNTANGIFLQCPPMMDYATVLHLCDIAAITPDYPVDIVQWAGPDGDKYIVWNARIKWRAKQAIACS